LPCILLRVTTPPPEAEDLDDLATIPFGQRFLRRRGGADRSRRLSAARERRASESVAGFGRYAPSTAPRLRAVVPVERLATSAEKLERQRAYEMGQVEPRQAPRSRFRLPDTTPTGRDRSDIPSMVELEREASEKRKQTKLESARNMPDPSFATPEAERRGSGGDSAPSDRPRSAEPHESLAQDSQSNGSSWTYSATDSISSRLASRNA